MPYYTLAALALPVLCFIQWRRDNDDDGFGY